MASLPAAPIARLRSSTRISCSSGMTSGLGSVVGNDSKDRAPGSGLQGGKLRGLGSQCLDTLVKVDHETRVGAGADLVKLVLGSDLEQHFAPVNRRHGRGDLDRRAHESGG